MRVEGLRELRRDLRKVSKELDGEVRDGLKDVVGIVVDESKRIAERKGLRDTGKLIRGIKPSVTARSAKVVSTATRRGYRYPAVFEFGLNGNRAFMVPALEAKAGDVERKLEDVLEELFQDNGWRGDL